MFLFKGVKEMFEKLDFGKLVRIVVFGREGEIRDVTSKYIKAMNYGEKEGYEISEVIIEALFHKEHWTLGWEWSIDTVILPRNVEPFKITSTKEIYCNTPLWTKTYKILWFKIKYIGEYWYVGYKLSPRLGSSINHWVSKFPERVTKNEDEVKNEELPKGHKCIYCSAELPEEPEYYEWGLGDKNEPTVPVFICPKCGRENYGFRVGELLKNCYDPLS